MSRNQRQIFKTKNDERCANKVFKHKCANIKAGVIIPRPDFLHVIRGSDEFHQDVTTLTNVLQRLHRTLGSLSSIREVKIY